MNSGHNVSMRQRIEGMAASIGIVAIVVATPLLLIAIDATPTRSDTAWRDLEHILTSPDDGTAALTVITVVAWVAWLIMAASLLVEIAAAVRGAHPPRLPGLRLPQATAARLVSIAALFVVTLPTTAQAVPPPAHAIVTSPTPPTGNKADEAVGPTVARTSSHASAVKPDTSSRPSPETFEYNVKRGDSLWRIARDQLGDGRRYTELVGLNSDRLNGHPDFLVPGQRLRVPNEAAPHDVEDVRAPDHVETYTIKPADTLSQIAQRRLGDATRYPDIFEASRTIVQPDGDTITDPDVIRPGWRLNIPIAPDSPTSTDRPRPDKKRPARTIEPQEPGTPTTKPTHEFQEEGEADESARAVSDDLTGTESRESATPPWLLPGLAGAGTLLAASLYVVVRNHRSTQQRFRRPGHMITPTAPEAIPVDKTIHVNGGPATAYVEKVHAVLRTLANDDRNPDLIAVRVSEHQVTIDLATEMEMDASWEGSTTTWSLPMDRDLPEPSGDAAPYPLVAAVGQTTDDQMCLLNLERAKRVVITGNHDNAAALGRYIVAELALNPWSDLTEIHTLGIAEELATLNPMRLHHHVDGDRGILNSLATQLRAEATSSDEPEQFRAIVMTGDHSDTSQLDAFHEAIANHPGRPGATIIAVNGRRVSDDDLVLDVTADGHLTIPAMALDLIAAGLTPAEADACTAIADLTRTASDQPIPNNGADTDGWHALTNAAGALRNDLTDPRPDGPAGSASLLPDSADTYKRSAPTTSDDVDALAPVTKPEIHSRAGTIDPDLDDELAAWWDTDCPLPRVSLLGPIVVRAHGDRTAVRSRKAHYTELVAYLSLRPQGVTTQQVMEAFDIKSGRVRVDINAIRAWLGENPRSGKPHVPHAKSSRAFEQRGIPTYQLDDVLIDYDLFRRLRARGQARGADGVADLKHALQLVAGPPFTGIRDGGWAWLVDDPIQHVMTAAIADTAHIITARALAEDDLELARFAAETGHKAAPDDEVCRLDLVEVNSAEGHGELAQRQLFDDVLNRSDDGLPPIDLPERTSRIVTHRGWNTRHRRDER